MEFDRRRADIGVLDDVFDAETRQLVVEAAAKATFEPQDLGRRLAGLPRERAVLDSTLVQGLLWDQVNDFVHPIAEWLPDLATGLQLPGRKWAATGCNPRSRLYRYGLGADFRRHADEPWCPSPWKMSMLTLLLYLPANGCAGGETVVDGEVIQPVDWRIAIFDHRLMHEGKPVEQGNKLVLRNDVIVEADTP